MSDLAEFLLARVAEDEAHVNGTAPRNERVAATEVGSGLCCLEIGGRLCILPAGHMGHPTRVLTECAAKRHIASLASWEGKKDSIRDMVFGPSADEGFRQGILAALRALALPYADHPDYREEWRP